MLGWFPVFIRVVYVQGPLMFFLYTSDLPMIQEKTFVDYDDDSTLQGEIPKPSNRVSAVVSRSRTLVPVFPNLLLGGNVVERVAELKVYSVFRIQKCHTKVISG